MHCIIPWEGSYYAFLEKTYQHPVVRKSEHSPTYFIKYGQYKVKTGIEDQVSASTCELTSGPGGTAMSALFFTAKSNHVCITSVSAKKKIFLVFIFAVRGKKKKKKKSNGGHQWLADGGRQQESLTMKPTALHRYVCASMPILNLFCIIPGGEQNPKAWSKIRVRVPHSRSYLDPSFTAWKSQLVWKQAVNTMRTDPFLAAGSVCFISPGRIWVP